MGGGKNEQFARKWQSRVGSFKQSRLKARLAWSAKTWSRFQRECTCCKEWVSGQGAHEKKEDWLTEKGREDKELLNIATSLMGSAYPVISSHFTLIFTFNPHKNPRGRNYNYLHFTDKIVEIQIFCPGFLKLKISNTKMQALFSHRSCLLKPWAVHSSHSVSSKPSGNQQVHVFPLVPRPSNIPFRVQPFHSSTYCLPPSYARSGCEPKLAEPNSVVWVTLSPGPTCLGKQVSILRELIHSLDSGAAATFSPAGLPFPFNLFLTIYIRFSSPHQVSTCNLLSKQVLASV